MAKKRSNIGGQAVIEGVMMMGEKSIATAVRDPQGTIVIETKRRKSVKQKNFLFRTPFIRGIFNFLYTMVTGVSILMRSAEVFDGDTEPTKVEKWFAKKFKVNVMSVAIWFAVILGLALSIGLFFFLPQLITSGIDKLITKDINGIWYNLMEGVIRIFIFVMYIVLVSLMKDIKKTFMYHGAEHKTISCYESGLPLNVSNCQKMSTVHDRCGTTFMFIVMIISVLLFSLTGWESSSGFWGGFFGRFLIRLALLPVVAGVSYEILKFLARFDNLFVKILKSPGLLLQKLTTKQPTDDMVEVAIAAFNAVTEMDGDENVKERSFDVKTMCSKSRAEADSIVKNLSVDASDIDFLYAHVLNIKRGELDNISYIKSSEHAEIIKAVKRRAAGEPIQQIIGTQNFFGYEFVVDENVLIPRPETELLVERAISITDSMNLNSALDICTGTGAIGITLKLKVPAIDVTISDISDNALSVAQENANRLGAAVNIVRSDMFEDIDPRYDMIISNPPYIKSAVIETLDAAVKDYEPRTALDGGADGMDFYRIIAEKAHEHLNSRGYLLLEVGEGQADAVKKMLEAGYETAVQKDYADIDRIIIARIREEK